MVSCTILYLIKELCRCVKVLYANRNLSPVSVVLADLLYLPPAQVHKLTHSQQCTEEHTAKKLSGLKPPVPSPVKAKRKGKKGGAIHNNLQLLRETQKFRNSLKQDDLSWET